MGRGAAAGRVQGPKCAAMHIIPVPSAFLLKAQQYHHRRDDSDISTVEFCTSHTAPVHGGTAPGSRSAAPVTQRPGRASPSVTSLQPLLSPIGSVEHAHGSSSHAYQRLPAFLTQPPLRGLCTRLRTCRGVISHRSHTRHVVGAAALNYAAYALARAVIDTGNLPPVFQTIVAPAARGQLEAGLGKGVVWPVDDIVHGDSSSMALGTIRENNSSILKGIMKFATSGDLWLIGHLRLVLTDYQSQFLSSQGA